MSDSIVFTHSDKRKRIDLTGKTFGRLTVVYETEPALSPTTGTPTRRWLCRCLCGKAVIIRQNALTFGVTVSCGCYHKELVREISKYSTRTHGHATKGHVDPTYNCWCAIVKRCENPKSTGYKYYGGRGITVCKRWRESFEAFLADMGPRPEGMSIDRIGYNGHYEPGNCRWATAQEQANNSRKNHRLTYDGQTQTLAEWGRKIGIPGPVIWKRLRRGWSVERALTEPVNTNYHRVGH